MHDIEDDLSQRLLLAESDLLTALEGGSTMFSSYYQAWSALSDDLHAAMESGNVDNDKLTLIKFVALRISNLATCFLAIRREEELATSQLQNDCEVIFRQMDALDLNAPSKPSPRGPKSFTPRTETSISIQFPAYQWLMDNLYNPYPTAEVKAQIAVASSCQVSSINSWFISVRRRIGWTTICREHFSNCRADMIDAAYCALVENDPRHELSPEVRHSFVAMKVAAEGLYPMSLTRGALAGDLDATTGTTAEQDSTMARFGKRNELCALDSLKVAQDSYPTPDPSATTSPVRALSESFTDESEDENVEPVVNVGFKRPRSSIEPVDQPCSADGRPVKRLRSSAMSRTCLSSPPSSADGFDTLSDDSSSRLSPKHPPTTGTTEVLPPHKRHCLDTSGTETPRCLSGLTASPRSQFEKECSIDDWFNTNFSALFDIPPPVVAIEPDISAQWEVELFKDYKIPENTTSLCPPPLEPEMITTRDFSDLDKLLQSICNDSTVPHQTNTTEESYTAPLDLSLPDALRVDPYWISPLDAAGTYQPTVYSTFPQYSINSQLLPEIDLSMLQLPPVIPENDTASKQAKLRQLHSMQEAVWRMEQELRYEGVAV